MGCFFIKKLSYINKKYMIKRIKGYLETKGDGIIEGIASTETVDRHGEVVMQDGWDLKNFKKSPVLMLQHNYQELPIGKIEKIKVEDKKLVFKAIFSETTQKAKEAYALVKEGILNSFSVGFIPLEYDANQQNIITKAELLEISLVAIPANPEAVVLAKSIEKNDFANIIVKEFLIDEENQKKVSEIEEKNKKEIKDNGTSKVIEDNDKKNREESAKVEAKELDIKLLQKATGHLQELLCEMKKKGGANK